MANPAMDHLKHLTSRQAATTVGFHLMMPPVCLFLDHSASVTHFCLLSRSPVLRDGRVARSVSPCSLLSLYPRDVGRQVGWSTLIKAAGNTNNQLQRLGTRHMQSSLPSQPRAIVLIFSPSVWQVKWFD